MPITYIIRIMNLYMHIVFIIPTRGIHRRYNIIIHIIYGSPFTFATTYNITLCVRAAL